MAARFTADLWNLAQDGGLTLTEAKLSQTLMAFAMQKYYEEKNPNPGYNQQLFTDLAAPGVGADSGGIRFDMADVAESGGFPGRGIICTSCRSPPGVLLACFPRTQWANQTAINTCIAPRRERGAGRISRSTSYPKALKNSSSFSDEKLSSR